MYTYKINPPINASLPFIYFFHFSLSSRYRLPFPLSSVRPPSSWEEIHIIHVSSFEKLLLLFSDKCFTRSDRMFFFWKYLWSCFKKFMNVWHCWNFYNPKPVEILRPGAFWSQIGLSKSCKIYATTIMTIII